MKHEEKLLKNITPDFFFAKSQDEKVNFLEEDLIELKPYGMSLNQDTTSPFLLLRDDKGEHTLPVSISQIEAGVALTQSSKGAPYSTVHAFTEKLLKSLDLRINRCLFVEINGPHQYVRLYMSGHPKYQSMKVKASDVMSLCLHLSVPFFATPAFIQKSKVMTAELSEQENQEIQDLMARPGAADYKKNIH